MEATSRACGKMVGDMDRASRYAKTRGKFKLANGIIILLSNANKRNV